MATTTFDQWCHSMRQQIDACIKNVKVVLDIKPEKGIREVALCHTKLQEAKMWLGKALEEFGSQLPEQYRDEAKQEEYEHDMRVKEKTDENF